MNTVIAIDSFKGRLTSLQAGNAAAGDKSVYFPMPILKSDRLLTAARVQLTHSCPECDGIIALSK